MAITADHEGAARADVAPPLNMPAYARLRERICADIVAGVWRPGAHMTLAKLAAHYGVSQNPVREALFRLEGDGVVESRSHHGVTIPQVDAAYIANVYDVRGAIERLLKSAAARNASPAQVQNIERAGLSYEHAAAAGDASAIVLANRVFHRAIYTAASNPVAVAMMEARSTLVDSVRATVGYGPQRLDLAIRQHRAITAAIRRHDAERAGHLAIIHTEASKRDLLARFARR